MDTNTPAVAGEARGSDPRSGRVGHARSVAARIAAGCVVAVALLGGGRGLLAGPTLVADAAGAHGDAATAAAGSRDARPTAVASAAVPSLPGSEACLQCHPTGHPGKRVVGEPPTVDIRLLAASPHAHLACSACHTDVDLENLPHPDKLKKVDCGACHIKQQQQYGESLHGQAAARGDRLAPTCRSCHGTHDVLASAEFDSPTNTMNVPALCNRCHREGSPVQSFYHIPQDSILSNYTESIHGEGLFKKGLLTTAVCTSCHTAHHQLPHTDPRSSIARANVATTCMQCHVRIEAVHVKVVRGELWQRSPNSVPACVDCHQPHRIRRAFYVQGMADRDCLACHEKRGLVGRHEGKQVSMTVDADELQHSRHAKVACAQCHTGVNPSLARPCATVAPRVDCSVCHAQVVDVYNASVHGQLAAKQSPDAPVCADCHGTHGIRGHLETDSPTYAKHVPELCGQCHRSGHKAALRYHGPQQQVVEHYEESIHGKGLLESGLVVTATCVDCHTTHGELPARDPRASVNRANIAGTCARCHRGIYEQFESSIHSPRVSHSKQPLPVCSDCHTAHTIERTDREDFRLDVIQQCGRCHQQLTASYFETYHGKVSKLGYVKTAKCYDCHGAHDILPPWDPKSHLSRANIVSTCNRCHPAWASTISSSMAFTP